MYWNILWLALMVVFLIAEAASVAMVSLWFAVGALGALIAGLCGGPVWLQAVIFFLLSGVSLALLRPLVRKRFTPRITRTNVDAVVGTAGTVTEEIRNVEAAGQVKLGAMVWSARSTDGSPIPAGTRVRVDRVEGVKVFVSPAEETVTQS